MIPIVLQMTVKLSLIDYIAIFHIISNHHFAVYLLLFLLPQSHWWLMYVFLTAGFCSLFIFRWILRFLFLSFSLFCCKEISISLAFVSPLWCFSLIFLWFFFFCSKVWFCRIILRNSDALFVFQKYNHLFLAADSKFYILFQI